MAAALVRYGKYSRSTDDTGAPVPSFTVGVESFSGAQTRSLRSTPPRKVDDPDIPLKGLWMSANASMVPNAGLARDSLALRLRAV